MSIFCVFQYFNSSYILNELLDKILQFNASLYSHSNVGDSLLWVVTDVHHNYNREFWQLEYFVQYIVQYMCKSGKNSVPIKLSTKNVMHEIIINYLSMIHCLKLNWLTSVINGVLICLCTLTLTQSHTQSHIPPSNYQFNSSSFKHWDHVSISWKNGIQTEKDSWCPVAVAVSGPV